MKFFILLFFVFINSVAFSKDFFKIDELITANQVEIKSRYFSSSSNMNEIESSVKIAINIKNGNCPEEIDPNLLGTVLTVFATGNTSQMTLGFDCLEHIGFDKTDYYNVAFGLFGGMSSSSEASKAFLLRFYKDYKVPGDSSMFGLIDIAKLLCAEEAIFFLENNDFPKNQNNLFTDEEYEQFNLYIEQEHCKKYKKIGSP